jgi:hypothetical protein
MGAATAFAGPLCRYFAGHDGDAARLVQGIVAWRHDVNEALQARLHGEQLEWHEAADTACLACDLDAAGWTGLRLFACLAERSHLELPDRVPALLELDQEWRKAVDAKFANSLYGQILAPRVWLPGDFGFTFRGPLPDGDTVDIGSLSVLHDQLRWLNQRTFQADAATLASWRSVPAPAGAALLLAAQRGLAGLAAAAAFAREHALPLLVRQA